MADNPFDPKSNALLAAALGMTRRNSLWDYVQPPSGVSPNVRDIANLLTNKGATSNGVFGSGLFSPFDPAQTPFGIASPPAPTRNSLADLVAPPPALYSPPKLRPVLPDTKRKVFFSFQFDGDIMRVNVVRKAWQIANPSANRTYYDSSLWEARKIEAPDAIKNLIRAGVLYTSAVCILTGSTTWDRRWVRYEIARAIIDGRGLLTVHINNIRHHRTKSVHPRGLNPLAHMGIAKLQPNKYAPPQYYLFEMWFESDRQGGLVENWTRYSDHMAPVEKPGWLPDMAVDNVMPLSVATAEYDYIIDGGKVGLGHWIDLAAKQAGR